MLYTCYELIRPDVALELAWRNGYYDFFMPYIIQYMRHSHDKIKDLETKASSKEAEKEANESSAAVNEAAVSMGLYGGQLLLTDGNPMLTNEAYNPNMGYGAQYGGDQGYAGAGYAQGGYGAQYGQQPGYGGGW